MILIVTIDERFGMAFNKRRLSQDRVQQERMLEVVGNAVLWMNAYSKKLFPDCDNINIDENFLDKASEGDFCFAEITDVTGYIFEKIILYRWNSKYPSDLKLGIDLSHYRLVQTTDIVGAAHDKITEEVYIK